MAEVKDDGYDFMAQPITYRRHLVEMATARGAMWWMAEEAVASTLLEHPEIDGDRVQTRREWAAGV